MTKKEIVAKYESVATMLEIRALQSGMARLAKLQGNRLVIEYSDLSQETDALVSDLDERLDALVTDE